jgi:hypothetical protein
MEAIENDGGERRTAMRSRIVITFDPPEENWTVIAATSAITAAGVPGARVRVEREDAWVALWEPPFDRMLSGGLYSRYIVNDAAKGLLEAVSDRQVLVRMGGVPGKYHSIEATVNFQFKREWNPGNLNRLGYLHEGGVNVIDHLVRQYIEDMKVLGGPELPDDSVTLPMLTSWVRSVGAEDENG